MVRVEMIVLRKNFVVTYVRVYSYCWSTRPCDYRTALNNLWDKIYD